ncbi:MAG: DUF4058 family protein [bacterium]|nr:DUF4058 family protein [bacterium]
MSSISNQYLGINAHLHSHFLHTESEGWEEFHSSHITDLTRALNAHLPQMGYIARQERSLQIRHFDEPLAPISDVLISDVSRSDTAPLTFAMFQAQTALQVPASTLLEREPADLKRPTAIKIYEGTEGVAGSREKPVAWIELLSPSNKAGSGYASYVAKREALLANWLVFVELDYLHGISTTLQTLPDYRPSGRDQKPRDEAHPYHLWLIDPRQPPDEPQSAAIAAFDVDQPIPMLSIPLNRGDMLHFDFNVVYHQTFRAQPAFGLAVNYATAPEAVERDYNERDQRAIAARMLTVQRLHREGSVLPDKPHGVDPRLMEGLRRHPEFVSQVLRAVQPITVPWMEME